MKLHFSYTALTDVSDDYTMTHIAPAVLGIVIVLDIIFLFYILFSKDTRFEKYGKLLVLIHGSIPIIGKTFSTTDNSSLLLLLTLLLIICLYTVFTDNDIFVQIVTTINTITMIGIIIQTTIGMSILAKILKCILFIGISGMFIVLSLRRFETLYRIQIVLVCYFVLAFFTDTTTDFKVLANGEKTTKTIVSSFVFDVLIIIGMVYVVFN